MFTLKIQNKGQYRPLILSCAHVVKKIVHKCCSAAIIPSHFDFKGFALSEIIHHNHRIGKTSKKYSGKNK